MKEKLIKFTLTLALVMLGTPLFAQEGKEGKAPAKENFTPPNMADWKNTNNWPALKTEDDKISYSIGFQMAMMYLQHRDQLNEERMVQGFRDSFEQQKPLVNFDEAEELLNKFEQKVRALEKKSGELEAVQNQRISDKFLEENKKKEGVIVTKSGLQYKVIKEGRADGAKPKADDHIRFHYIVKNADGVMLDDSHRLSKPIGASIKSLIKGWQ